MDAAADGLEDGGWFCSPGPHTSPENEQRGCSAKKYSVSSVPGTEAAARAPRVPSQSSSISARLFFPKTAVRLRFLTSASLLLPPPLRVGLVFLQMFVFSADENIHIDLLAA